MHPDPLAALSFALNNRLLPPPAGRVLWLNAPGDPGMAEFREYQPLLQRVQAGAVEGFATTAEIPRDYAFDTVIVSGTRQQVETAGLLAQALDVLRPGGLLIAMAGRDAGGKRLARTLVELGAEVQSLAKYHARVVWGRRRSMLEQKVLRDAIAAAAVQPVLGGRFVSRPGLFSWDRVDPASALLTAQLPALAGRGADFGCGYGFLAAHILQSGAVEFLSCVDADAHAVECCRRNVPDKRAEFLWADIADAAAPLPRDLDFIVTNPPFHAGGHAAVPELGQAFIARAAAVLRPGGVLWLVANRQLPYEICIQRAFSTMVPVCEDKNFKVVRAIK